MQKRATRKRLISRRRILSIILALTFVITMLQGGAVNASADDGIVTTAEFLNPPSEVKWIDEKNLILGVTPVEGANAYYFRFSIQGKKTFGTFASKTYVEEDGYVHFRIKTFLTEQESYEGVDYSGKLTTKVYAVKGHRRPDNLNEAKYTEAAAIQYQGSLGSLVKTATPGKPTISLNDGKLNVRFPMVSEVGYEKNSVYEYQVELLNDAGATELIPSYPNNGEDKFAENGVYTITDGQVSVLIPSFSRSKMESEGFLQNGASLRARVRARSDVINTETPDKLNVYRVSDWSEESNSIIYISDSLVPVMVSQEEFITGMEKEISDSDTILKDNSNVTSLKIRITPLKSNESFNTKAYSGIVPFEINLIVTRNGKEEYVPNTKKNFLITLPIPEEFRGKKIIILRKHEGAIEELGAIVNGDTVSFYTDKFSDYAIAVKIDVSAEKTDTEPTPTTPQSESSSSTFEDNRSTPTVKPNQKPAEGTKSNETKMTVQLKSMYRLYNPNSGEHLYTLSNGERKHLVRLGWKDESTDWKVPTEGVPVYRVYNPNTGDHHYTTKNGERKNLVRLGWKDEGIAWYAAKEGRSVYRLYNPNTKGAGSHLYTTNRGEQKSLIKLGWRDEGIAWYVS